MSRKRHIDTRNLVVCDTFDEFAEKVGQCDQNVEDIVGYVTSVSRVFYWLNVESVWGVLGFTWEPSSLQPLEGVPYLEERLEHVEASGAIIDYSQKDAAWKLAHAVTKGYGHFNATTMPFTIIPKLPDGYRITEFNHTFDLIEADSIEVQKSDWSNLVDINYLIPAGKSINIDITGANLSSDNKVIIDNVAGDWKHTVYIKGDLHNCTNGIFEYSGNAWNRSHTILLDDKNKELDIPMSLATANVFYYTNKEKIFDIADWIYKNTDSPVNLQYNLYAASFKYYIDNALTNKIWNGTNSALRLFSYATYGIEPKNFTGITKIVDPIAEGITPLNITVDCTEDGIVREDRLCGVTIGPGNFNYADNTYTYDTQVFEPIKYIGTPTSITMWNPFCLVKDDNDWPEYSQSMIDKLTKFDAAGIEGMTGLNTYGVQQGYFMYGAYMYITKPSPYTIDCTNIRYLNLFERAHFIVSDSSSFRNIGGNKKALEVVKLTNADNLFSFFIGRECIRSNNFYFTVPSIKTVFFNIEGQPRIFIPSETIIELAFAFFFAHDSVYVENVTIPHFKFRHIDAREYGMQYSMRLDLAQGVAEVGTSTGPVNLYDFESGVLTDVDFLKASHINTFVGTSILKEVIHPIVLVDNSINYPGFPPIINSSFVFVYKANITLSHGSMVYTPEQTTAAYNAFETILPGIQVNDTTNTYTIKLKKSVFDLLTESEKNYIMNTLNYTLTYDI